MRSFKAHESRTTRFLQDEGEGPALPASVTASAAIIDATVALLRANSTAPRGVPGDANPHASKRRRVGTGDSE